VWQYQGTTAFVYPQTAAVGNIDEDGVTNTAKFADSDINAMAVEYNGYKHTYYGTADDTTKRVYIRTNNKYEDGKKSWGIDEGAADQCEVGLGNSYSEVSWAYPANNYGLDFWAMNGDESCNRYMMSHGSSSHECYATHKDRCFTGGSSCGGYKMMPNGQLWLLTALK